MKRFSGARKNHLLLLLPIFLLFSVFLFLPFSQIIVFSFMQYDPIHIIGSNITLDNYVGINNAFYQRSMLYTFNLSVAVTVICLILGYPMSYILARMRSRQLASMLIVLLLAPLMVGTVIRTYGWMIVLGENGFLGYLVNAIIPTAHINLLGTTIAVIVGLVNVSLPFSILPLMASIEKNR